MLFWHSSTVHSTCWLGNVDSLLSICRVFIILRRATVRLVPELKKQAHKEHLEGIRSHCYLNEFKSTILPKTNFIALDHQLDETPLPQGNKPSLHSNCDNLFQIEPLFERKLSESKRKTTDNRFLILLFAIWLGLDSSYRCSNGHLIWVRQQLWKKPMKAAMCERHRQVRSVKWVL